MAGDSAGNFNAQEITKIQHKQRGSGGGGVKRNGSMSSDFRYFQLIYNVVVRDIFGLLLG